MKYISLLCSWFFCIIFLIVGMVTIFESPLAGSLFFLLSLLLLPPAREYFYLKTKIKLSGTMVVFLVLVLIICYGIISAQNEKQYYRELDALKAQKKAEEIAAIRQQNLDYFNSNSSKILKEVKTALNSAKYKDVLSLSEKYLPSGNRELINLQNKAKDKLSAIERANKEAETKKILSILKKIPVSQYKRNRDLYSQLVTLNPNIDRYIRKLNFYTLKIKETKKKEQETKIAKANTVENAIKLCAVFDGTGMLSKPCDVSGWHSSVDVTIGTSPSEAREICSSIVKMMGNDGVYFSRGWKIRIYSPFSNGETIAICNLPSLYHY